MVKKITFSFLFASAMVLFLGLTSCKKIKEYCPKITLLEPLTDYPQINGGNLIEFQSGEAFRVKFSAEDVDAIQKISVKFEVYTRKTAYPNIVDTTPYIKELVSDLSTKYVFDELITITDIASYTKVPFLGSITVTDTKGNSCTQNFQVFITSL